MYTILVSVIFLAFISLGLPDSLLGSAWPIMHLEMNTSLANAGIVSMIISMSTIVSALLSDKLNNKLGTKKVVAYSIVDTALAMFLFSIASSFWQLCLLAIPYGLGAGSIDAALNNYVALHMKAKHMSWLHCMWGIGATVSPCIMSFSISYFDSWRYGYRIVGFIQILLALIVIFSFPIWDKISAQETKEDKQISIPFRKVIKLNGAKKMLIGFMCYCALESTGFIWSSSYFANHFLIEAEKAAMLGSLFYFGLMISRALIGFIAEKVGDQRLIKYSSLLILSVGLIIYLLNNIYISMIGFILLGFGAGPIYPSFIHSTPISFNRAYSQSIIGIQMACAYVGTIVAPYMFGLIAENIDIVYLPLMVGLLGLLVYIFAKGYFKEVKQ